MTEFALRRRLPSAFPIRSFVEAGGLISYGPLEAEMQRATERAAVYMDRVLRGARVAEMAIDQPSRYEFALNARTASAIGISLPRALVLRADALIN
jgi:putative ABC transport system substrate-binding protein